jgi:protein SSD1
MQKVKSSDSRAYFLTLLFCDAIDLDDALHIKRLEDGCFEVGVHIADVTHYVKQNSLLDSEVEKRGTTTYLTNRSIPMLPPALSEDLCSLNPHSDK